MGATPGTLNKGERLMPWEKNMQDAPKRQDNALCLGGCGYRLPLWRRAILLPDQRNHYGRGMCETCCKRTYERARRKPAKPAVQDAPAGG